MLKHYKYVPQLIAFLESQEFITKEHIRML